MADYWKSQARKFCDFCKCWIADNKPSIQFHETGKRHKENVAQKLALLTKRSVKEQKESIKVDEEMRKMEEAAMKAYMKDIESNPDYTSKLIIDKAEEKRKQIELEQEQLKVEEDKTTDNEKEEEKDVKSGVGSKAEQKVWYEAKSDEGYTYYWNYLTGESVWEPPKEGFLSIAEQDEQNVPTLTESQVDETVSQSDQNKSNKTRKEKEESDAIDNRKRVENVTKDNKKRKRKNEEKNDQQSDGDCDNAVAMGPSMKPDPYGGWTAIDNRVPDPVDLELPQQDYIEIKVPVVENEQPQFKFKEKTITGLGEMVEGPSTFKKRKFNANRGNMRRKFSDDNDDDIG